VELPRRPKHDVYTPPGRYRELEAQVRRRAVATGDDTPILFIYAFDRRTRLGPFLFVDKSLIPGAPRAVPSALHAAGFTNVRSVMQQWNPRIRPSAALLGGRRPEVLFVSSMQIHSANAYDLIRDAWTLGDDRPLILAGGSKAIYEPWDFFGLSAEGTVGADVVVTGEEFVILELMERILDCRAPGETMRAAFQRARNSGLLEDIPGLVYRPDESEGMPEYLINTGVQRLVQDLDELPLPFAGLGLFEPPHLGTGLAPHPVPIQKLGKYASIMSMITTHGCKFHCPYCPIPAYNQYTFRHRSPERLVEELQGVVEQTGIKKFFGTDDNFFNNRESVEAILSAMAGGTAHGKPFRKALSFATEATEFDVDKNQDLLPLARDAGVKMIWFGIEDLTAGLVKKGQSPEKTKNVFKLLLKHGIAPMPMMMHHDGQPLWTWKGLYGLINQVLYLFKAGAVTCQVTLLTPSVGSKGYEAAFREGLVLRNVAGKPVEEYQLDGNHCIASGHTEVWRRQLNMLLSYASFYNPVNLLRSLPRFDKMWAERIVFQLYGMVGLTRSAWQLRDWVRRLISGPIEKLAELPKPKFRMVVPDKIDLGLAHYNEGMRLPVLS